MTLVRALAVAVAIVGSIAACNSLPPSSPGSFQVRARPRTQTPFSVSTTANVLATLPLPTAQGFSGTVAFPSPIPTYSQVTQTLQNVSYSGSPGGVLVYYGLLFDRAIVGKLGLSLNVPQKLIPSGKYYLALYDPQRPSLGWQRAYAGPAKAAGQTLTFAAGQKLFNRYEQYWFAAYALPSGAPNPTAAPAVSPSISPTPPPVVIPLIQNRLSQANSCSGTPCATGPLKSPQPTAMYLVTNGVKVPSKDGSSTEFDLWPSAANRNDVLYYTQPLVEVPLATAAVWTFSYQINQPVWSNGPKGIYALEFDFNAAMPNYTFNFSSQCVFPQTGKPYWEIWGGTKWVPAGFACDPNDFTPGKWYRAVWVYRWNPVSLTTQYVSLTINNHTVTLDPSTSTFPVQARPGQTRSFLEVQFQQDTYQAPSPSQTPFVEWVDAVSLQYR